MSWPTSATVLNAALRELGLLSADVTDPFASTDPLVAQAISQLNALGQDMQRDYQWSQLTAQYHFDTVNGTAAYSLPTDYGRMVDQSHWNRTAQWPVGGPVNAQGWEMMQALTSAGLVTKLYRVWRNQLYLSPTPSAAETVYYEYVSAYWVEDDGGGAPDAARTTSKDDLLWFDERLLVTGLKHYLWMAKGFGDQYQRDFDLALSRAQGGDGGAPVLHLDGRGMQVNRLLDMANIPESGYGT